MKHPELAQKAIDNFRDEARELSDEVTVVGFIGEGGSYYMSDNHACHAGLSDCREENLNFEDVYCLVSQVQDPIMEDNDDANIAYIDWLVNKSPWKDIFMDKDAKHIFDTRCYTVSPDHDFSFIAGGMFATRFMTEHETSQGRIELWWDLVCDGFDPSISFLVAHNFVKDSKGLISYGSDRYHTSISCGMTNKSCVNFLDSKIVNPFGKYRMGTYYRGVDELWGDVAYGNKRSLDKFCSTLQPEVRLDKRVYNIFFKEKEYRGRAVFTRETFKTVVPRVERFINEAAA